MFLKEILSILICVFGISYGFLDKLDTSSGTGDLHSQVFLAIEKIGILEQQVAALKAENDKIPKLETEVARLTQLQSRTTGVVYTRWGRTTCPNNATQKIYSGYVGGSKQTEGGAANLLCLPTDPTWERYRNGIQGGAGIYGVDYEFNSDATIGDMDRTNVNDKDTPCVVCNHLSHSSFYMVPGRSVCHSGWTLEYKGYLMSGAANVTGASEYICVDVDPEGVMGQNANVRQLFHVEARCQGLRCPPYVDGREITCAVCSK